MNQSTLWRLIEESPSAHPSAPRRFARPLPRGLLRPGAIVLSVDGVTPIDQQVEVPSTWDDGTASLAVVTYRGPLAAGLIEHSFSLFEGSPPPPDDTFHLTWNRISPHTGLRLELTDTAGEMFTIEVTPAQTAMVMLGMVAGSTLQQTRGIEAWATPRSVRDHPRIRARMRWRGFSSWRGMLLDVTVENCRTDVKLADVSVASCVLTVDGTQVASTGACVHRAGSRWTWSGWIGDAGPRVRVVPVGPELAAMCVIPELDWSAPATADAVEQLMASYEKPDKADLRMQSRASMHRTADGVPLASFPLYRQQGDTGDRHDIGSITVWQAALVNGGSEPAADLTRWGDLNGSGAFQVHLRETDEDVGVRHGHPAWKSGNGFLHSSSSLCKADIAHHPLSGLLTWLLTGDERAAEELACWSLQSVRNNYPNDGSLQQPGDRREAWALRDLSRAAVFLPDHFWSKQYCRDVLEKTALEWEAGFAQLVSENPLGSYQRGVPTPSGRLHSPCAYISSSWQAAWFTAEALRCAELTGIEFFRTLAGHGWEWMRNFVLRPGTSEHMGATADAGTGFAYNSYAAAYEGIIDSKGQWAVKPGSAVTLTTPAQCAWWRTLSMERERYPLTPSDLCGPPLLLRPKSGAWASTPSEEYFEYSFGRVGLLALASTLELLEHAEVRAAGLHLLSQAKQRSGKSAWALQAIA